MRRGRPRAGKLALLAAAAALAGACANVLGVTDYGDAIEELCRCNTLDDCEDGLRASLEGASTEERQRWLQRYADLDCEVATCDSTAYECFYTAPGLCEEQGAACEVSQACCGFDFDDARAGTGCCAGKDGLGNDGQCCQSCRTCAEVLDEAASVLMPDTATLCRSHEEAWEDVVKCRNGKCSDECAGIPLGDCVECVANACKDAVAACVAASDP